MVTCQVLSFLHLSLPSKIKMAASHQAWVDTSHQAWVDIDLQAWVDTVSQRNEIH